MLSTPHVIAALRAKAGALAAYQAEAGRQAAGYARALEALAARSEAEVLRALEAIPRPGARPTAERVAGRPVVRPFCERWENHAEARAWALERLRGVPVLAVDGSQITPSTDYSVPIGAVQVGWFVNRHDSALPYEKDIRFEVLVPDDLEVEGASESFPDLQVNVRRFELECRVIVEFMRRTTAEGPPNGQRPLCIFDGSFAISFAAQMRGDLQKRYVGAVREMLAVSEETRVPVVGYVDGSHARDLAWMLHWLAPETAQPAVGDAALLRPLMRWGDRSEALQCARDDRLFERLDPDWDYYDRVHVVYLKTTQPNPPCRLDLPAWLLEAGELERVIDLVRAECVAGTGYPYGMETADAVAVITMADRERFYRTFQELLDGLGIPLRYARKAYSKRQRR
jgi:hypothetical protein